MKRIDFIFYLVMFSLLALVGLVLLGSLVHGLIYEGSKTEVASYTTTCEITQMVCTEEVVTNSSSKAVYRMGVKCDDFASTFQITDEQFALYAIGDDVEVVTTVFQYRDGKQIQEHKLK